MEKGQYYIPEADRNFQIYFKEDPLLESNPHFHDSIEFVFVTEGTIEAHLDDRREVLTKGDIFFAESYETHSYKQMSESIKAIVLVLSRDYVKTFREFYTDHTFPTYMLDKKKNESIINYVKDWLISDRTQLKCAGNSLLLFSEIISKYPLVKRHDYTGDIFLKELLRYIHLHYLEDITLKKMSHVFGYTVEHCSKTLKKAIKCNFREYVNLLRLKKAKELLADKSLNMTQSEVLYSCGFVSPATYYRVKKQIENLGQEI